MFGNNSKWKVNLSEFYAQCKNPRKTAKKSRAKAMVQNMENSLFLNVS